MFPTVVSAVLFLLTFLLVGATTLLGRGRALWKWAPAWLLLPIHPALLFNNVSGDHGFLRMIGSLLFCSIALVWAGQLAGPRQA